MAYIVVVYVVMANVAIALCSYGTLKNVTKVGAAAGESWFRVQQVAISILAITMQAIAI